jgi:uncharacterized membrane protein SpoIIM required for sporulation
MILDLERFVAENRGHWQELERMAGRLGSDPGAKLSYEDARRLHYLYERASADLARLSTFSAESQTRRYLSALVGRVYAEIYETRRRQSRFSPVRWFFGEFPRTFRRHIGAFALSVALTVGGTAFGAFAVAVDPLAKQVLMPFPGLEGDPGERVKKEESGPNKGLAGHRATFSAQLMTHNTRVALFTLALGVTCGVGSVLMLFYNGVILGAVALDYIRAGYTVFLLGWLMPHGVIEIPAILIAGQAAFVLARALIGRGDRTPPRQRLREVLPSVATLAGGCAVMLVWAGIVESFISQYHRPVLPYAAKIAFGACELIALCLFLGLAGRRGEAAKP